ncbi:MAG: immunoglobulin domain-containing protein [Sedimentisphaerales bacterium]|nr:immunoglobulin domain-containing protein [Sedimentisphaerales bacterium]
MMKKVYFAVMATTMVLMGMSVNSGAATMQKYGDFNDNQAAFAGFVFTPDLPQYTETGDPMPQTAYLTSWTYAKSSSGYGGAAMTYLAIYMYDATTGYHTLLGTSTNYIDFPATTNLSLMTWYFDYIPLDRDTQYAIMFVNELGVSSAGGVELDTTNATTNGVIQIGQVKVNQPTWETHFEATYESTTPFPTYVSPADSENNVATDVTLSWTAPTAFTPVGYNVYIDLYEPNLTAADAAWYSAGQAGTTYTPSPVLASDTIYYWRVEALEPNLVAPYMPIPHSGPAWQFTTAPKAVVIVTNPASQTVPAGDTVVLTMDALNATSYQWYKDGSLVIDQTTATLTLTDVQLADEGFYTCTASNALPSSATSVPAQVMTRRLAGWWKLEDPNTTGGFLADSVQTEVPGAPAHIATAAEYRVAVGKEGSAIELNGTTNRLVTVSDSTSFFNFYPQGYTVSAWINRSAATAWGAYVSKQAPATTEPAAPAKGFILTHNASGQPVHTLRTVNPNDLSSNVEADDNTWHLATGTYDAATKTSKIYVDGLLRNQVTYTAHPAISPAAVMFGAELPNGNIAYTGLLDDVRIWTYPLDDQAVANLYTDFNPDIYVCLERPELDVTGPNGVPDCKVDLYEFAEVAAEWLECGLYPPSNCSN